MQHQKLRAGLHCKDTTKGPRYAYFLMTRFLIDLDYSRF